MALFPRFGSQQEVFLSIKTKTFFKVLLLIVVTYLLLNALRQAAHALTLVFVAFFLAVSLNAPVSWMTSHLPGILRGSRSSATALSFLIVVAILGAFIVSFGPPIFHQTQSFINNAPQIVQNLHNQNTQIGRFIVKYHLQSQVSEISQELSTRLQHSSSTAVAAITQITSSLFASITILVITFMMVIEGPAWLKFLYQLLPERRHERVDRLIHDMYRVVKGYVNGQVLLAAIAASLVLPGLLVFHVSYPIALLAVVFICGLIPMVGHTFGAIIVTLVALFHSPFSAVGILVYYVLYQQIENYLIQPRLQANTTNLSPLLVFMSLIIGVSFDGLVGGLVAIPIVACLRVWVIDYLETRHILAQDTAPSTHAEK